MSPNRTALLGFALFAVSSGIHCDPNDALAPAATPENTIVAPPPDTPAAGPEVPAATNEPMYTSGEVAIGAESEGYDDDDPAALTDFHSALDSNGAWVEDTSYGRVWVPSTSVVGADFHPYVTAGHWTYDDDWVWVSDYDWGWAPFHYGRWVWIDGRGWSWIPGRVYRGAWVAWGVDDGYTYVGWAPMPPSFVWFGGVAVAFPIYVAPRWVYCPRGAVFSPAVRTRVVTGVAAAPIAGRVRPYVTATPGVAAGPPPQKMGFQEAQIPRPTAAATVTRAQQFARPATAQPLGARAPTRMAAVAPTPTGQVAARAMAGGAPHPMGAASFASPGPGAWHSPPVVATPGSPRAPTAPMPNAVRPQAAPIPGPARTSPAAGSPPPPSVGHAAPAAPAPAMRGGGGGGRMPTFHGGGGIPGGGGHHR